MTNEEYKKLSIDGFTKVAEKYPDRHYTGLDLTPAMIEQARKKNIPNADLLLVIVRIFLLMKMLLT